MPEVLITDEEEKKKQSKIQLYREYYDGEHKVYMTDRQKAWLKLHGEDASFTVNHIPTIVDAVVERLKVTGFVVHSDTEDQSAKIADVSEGESKEKTADEVLWDWWAKQRMDALQIDTHRRATIDGESFILIDWDIDDNRPDFILHPRFVAEEQDGDGSGMWMEFPYDDFTANPIAAVKQWYFYDEDGKKRYRRTYYYENRIEKYILDSNRWVAFIDTFEEVEDEEGGIDIVEVWPIPWYDDDGEPIGIPVAHYKNPELKSELRDAVPLQDALNKLWLDIMAASDSTAFRIFMIFGWVPTTDGKAPAEDGTNLLHILPGQMLATETPPSLADAKVIEPSDLAPLLNLEDRIVFRMASITDTPQSRFITTKQIAAESTLKQQESPLISKVEDRQTLFGNGWEDMMLMAAKLSLVFGEGYDFPEDATLRTEWKQAGTRDEDTEIENATKKKAMGIPLEQILSELGYDAEQIRTIMEMPEFKERLALLSLARVSVQGGSDESTTETE